MKNRKGKFAVAAAGTILLVLCSGCMPSAAKKHFPLVEVRLKGDVYPALNAHISVGLLFVACANGRAVRAESEQLAGRNFVEGKLSAQSLARLKERLAIANLRDLRAECESQAVDVGTAGVAIWNQSERTFLRCTWPPFEPQGKLLYAAIWEAEINDRKPYTGAQAAEQMCQ